MLFTLQIDLIQNIFYHLVDLNLSFLPFRGLICPTEYLPKLIYPSSRYC